MGYLMMTLHLGLILFGGLDQQLGEFLHLVQLELGPAPVPLLLDAQLAAAGAEIVVVQDELIKQARGIADDSEELLPVGWIRIAEAVEDGRAWPPPPSRWW